MINITLFVIIFLVLLFYGSFLMWWCNRVPNNPATPFETKLIDVEKYIKQNWNKEIKN